MAWRESWNVPTERERRYIQARGPRLVELPGVLWLLIINVAVFILAAMGIGVGAWLERYGTLSVVDFLFRLQVWRIVTYQFLHADLSHIFWNMFGLWMFGRIVEAQFGTRRFLWLYLLSGVAGGLAECVFNVALEATGVMVPLPFRSWLQVPMVGASAGVSGVIVAFAVRNPNALIYLFFLLPVRAKWAAIGWAVLTSWWTLELLHGGPVRGSMVAHAAHLGGMAFAFFWTLAARRRQAGRDVFAARTGGWPPRPPDADSRPIRYHPVVGGPNVPPADAEEERRLDGILRKVHDGGLDALTDDERRFLRYMSQRKRDEIEFDDRYRRE